MMRQDRFLWMILGGIALLVLLALYLFFSRQQKLTYSVEEAPEGVVHNYLLALEKEDYSRAYSYLAPQGRPEYEDFVRFFKGADPSRQQTAVRVGSSFLVGKRALVNLTLIHQSSQPFQDSYSEEVTADLVNADNLWRIARMPYPYWDWSWTQGTALP